MITDTHAGPSDISSGLLRQRRNLFIFGFSLLLFTIGGSDLKELHLIGNVMVIESQTLVMPIAFCLYIYFFWRYHQYCLKEQNLDKARQAFQKYLCIAQLDYFTKKVSYQIKLFNADHVYPSFNINRKVVEDAAEITSVADYPSSGYLVRQRLLFVSGIGGIFAYLNKNTPIDKSVEPPSNQAEIEIIWKLCSPDASRSTRDPIYKTWVEYNIIRIFILRVQCYLKFVFSRTYFTDYYIPYIFAWLTLIFSLLSQYHSFS